MALNQNLPVIVIEMLRSHPKLTTSLDDSSKKLLQNLIETLTKGQDKSNNSFPAGQNMTDQMNLQKSM